MREYKNRTKGERRRKIVVSHSKRKRFSTPAFSARHLPKKNITSIGTVYAIFITDRIYSKMLEITGAFAVCVS